MSTYAFRDAAGDVILSAPEFARPIPVHAQTPEALAAVETMRRIGGEARLQRELSAIVTEHGRPHVAPFDGDVVTPGALRLEAHAAAHGFETKLLRFEDSCRVEGYHAARRVGFTARWTRRRADGATWNAPYRYGIVRDDRPVGVSATTRVALAGKRPAGVDAVRLAILDTPRGVKITLADLNERITS